MADDRSTRSPSVSGSPPDDVTPPPPSGHAASASQSPGSAEALARPAGWLRPARLAAGICVLGLILTGLATWAVARADHNTEQRLLQTQTRQAAAVLSTAILTIQQPMAAALSAESVVGPSGQADAFTRIFTRGLGPKGPFVSGSLWHLDSGTFQRVAAVGVTPGLGPKGAELQDFLKRATTHSTSVVRRVNVGQQSRIAYALADPRTGNVVYAERAIPADQRSPVDRGPAFADLHYALYLGPRTSGADLTTTDVGPSSLPLSGSTARATVPFGDTVLTLVTTPRGHLGSNLSQRLPWIILLTGLLLTLAMALVARQLARSRQHAESDRETITTLYQRVDALYGEQRALSERLQRALLPQASPGLPGIEFSSEYVAGAQGVDIGGDWYSAIAVGEESFAFVVGDVSGNGVDAVAEMARARFTLRAYLIDGDGPATALAKCSRQFDVTQDGHIITVLVGVGSWRTGEITVANAGHPLPLLVTDGGSSFVEVPAGPPLGAGPSTYDSSTFTLPQGATLVAFTDGLVERRGEQIDVGMRRLADNLPPLAGRPLDTFVGDLLASMRTADTVDDIAVLALRRVGT
jgi:serine phosphatase RsbU (regulator of sigma subunit)